MKVRVCTTTIRYHDIEMDEKFRQCACPISKIDEVPDSLYFEAARTASDILGMPLSDINDEEGKEYIINAVCVDNDELVFEM